MNYQLFELINNVAGRYDGVDDLIEFGATWLIYPMFAVAAVLAGRALYRRRLRPVIELGVTLFLAFAAGTILAHLSTEVRPFQTHAVHQLVAHEPGVSLPSDHATAAFALAVGVGLFLHRGWGWVLAVVAVAVGFSRVWVGVHYPGDIAAAALIAVLAGLLVIAGRPLRHSTLPNPTDQVLATSVALRQPGRASAPPAGQIHELDGRDHRRQSGDQQEVERPPTAGRRGRNAQRLHPTDNDDPTVDPR